MPVRYEKWITRKMVQDHPDDAFVFGDNLMRSGFGGQAKAMRGEPNAIGVATKIAPSMTEDAFFADREHEFIVVTADLSRVMQAHAEGKTVVVPRDGLGTGLSQLPERAPRLYAFIWKFFDLLSPDGCPWVKPK